MSGPRVFVSHSHEDNAFCRPFVGHLRTALGSTDASDVFFDERSLKPGDEWLEVIQHEVMARPNFVVVLTPRSVESVWVRQETHLAIRLTTAHPERRIIGLVVEPCEVDRLAPLLSNYQLINMAPDGYDAAFAAVLAALHGRQSASAHTPAPAPPTANPRVERAHALAQEARVAADAGNWDDALLKADFALQQPGNKDNVDLLVVVARASAETGQWARARDAATRAIGLDAFRPDLYLLLARAEAEQGQADGAQAALDRGQAVASLSDERTRDAITALRRDLRNRIARDHFPLRFEQLGFVGRRMSEVEMILPPLTTVPGSEFLMGSAQRDTQAYDDEKPQHLVALGAYQIARYPVTVAEYACCVRAGQRPAPSGWDGQLKRLHHPVVNVSWHDAVAYAAWLTKMTGESWRLPTEAEWEKAARSADGRTYPWGNTWVNARANTSESGRGTTTPVGAYAAFGDASPYGVHDLAGNVWEWTSSVRKSYPYRAHDGRERADLAVNRVRRGGSWLVYHGNARTTSRDSSPSASTSDNCGFRVARDMPNSYVPIS